MANTIKQIAKKVANTGAASDYTKIPIGADSTNVDRPNATTVEASLVALETNKAPLASPAFTGTPTAPTPTAGDNDTSIATTAFVTTAVANKTTITGNAGTATKLATARTISLTGDATGSVSFDGSANVSITVAISVIDGGTF